MTAPAQHKFQTLDALRGVAALSVVLFHNGLLFGYGPPEGYLAVDMFFVLSGFVITYAYQARLDSGLSTWSFLKLRLIRLYPIYLLTLCMGVAVALGLAAKAHQLSAVAWQRAALYFSLNAFFLPAIPWRGDHPGFYPFNGPSWTLLLELLANVIHALFLRRRSTRTLAVVAAVSGAVLAVAALRHGTLDAGWDLELFTVGLPRVLFPYTVGMILFRLWRRHGRRASGLPPELLLLSLVVVVALPVPEHGRVVYCLLADALALPLIVYAGASSEPRRSLQGSFGVLGTASYAIYLLQFSFVYLEHILWRALFGHLPGEDPPWAGLALVVALVVSALLLDQYYDLPLRRWMKRRWA